jgi:hypothetical protein
MIRKARVDGNQKEIVNKLRAIGATVLHTHQLKNCFDILVGWKGKNFAFEIKDGSKPKSKRKLTEGEQKFFDVWRGQIDKVESFDDILKIINSTENQTLNK